MADKASSGHDDTVPAEADAGTAPAEAPPPEERYRFGKELGRGGMGRVVEAFDTHLGRTVAFKEVLEGGTLSMTRRFQREVRITARLEHASIVPLYDSGLMPDGRPFYVMRRVSGKPLDELIARASKLEHRLALLPNVLAAIDAIAHAHERGVIHRDLKPQNILVGELGETVVIDWGLAKVIDEEEPEPDSFEPKLPGDSLKTQVGAVFGTPGFMAPEQARGDELSARSDVFALGATLYQLLAGKPPVRGNSATEVIASTMRLRIVPLADAAPGSPPELVTIIEKALAAEPEDRYPNAAELAEDVRRFTTGQLVAAHRYTKAQRLARFAKRHRAALSIAALAMSAVAVLSWFSVHRILKERDVANAARIEAEQQRATAAREAERAKQRADQLLVAHARTILDGNPTAAVAVVKHVEREKGPLADEVAAVTKAAMSRGVAWGLPTLPDLITSFEMTSDGKRLLELDRHGRLQVLDVDTHEALTQTAIAGAFFARWVDHDRKIFMLRGKDPPAIYDPATNTVDTIATPMAGYSVAAAGNVLAYADATTVGLFDVATRKATPLWTGKPDDTVAIAPDGAWVALVDKATKRWRVVARSGKVLVDQPGEPSTFAVSPAGKLAVLQFGKVFEVQPAAGARPVAIPLDEADAKGVLSAHYRGESLDLLGLRLLTWNGKAVLRGPTFEGGALFAAEAAGGTLVVTANDGSVHVVRGELHLALPLTERPPFMVRVAASRTSTRIAATAKDAILVWNLAGLMPEPLDGMVGTFISNDTMLTMSLPDWDFWDVIKKTRRTHALKVEAVPTRLGVGEDGRFLVALNGPSGPSALVVYPDLKKHVVVDNIGAGLVALVPGDAVIYSLGKGRIFGKIGTAESRELVTVQGDIASLAPNGPLAYAALGATGELVKGTFGGADFARTQIKDLAPDAFITCDPERAVLVASGNRLLRWHGNVDEVARFATKIDSLDATDTGTYVALTTGELFFLAARGDRTPRRVPVAGRFAIVDHGKRVVALSSGAQLELVEMPALAKWTLPRLYTGSDQFTVSPDGRRIAQGVFTRTMVWTLPETPPPLDRLTNAADDEGALVWPWNP